MCVRGADGAEVALTFPAFVAAVEDGAIAPDDQVWSRIVTGGDWVRAGDMRLFQLLTGKGQPAPMVAQDIWPPPPLTVEE